MDDSINQVDPQLLLNDLSRVSENIKKLILTNDSGKHIVVAQTEADQNSVIEVREVDHIIRNEEAEVPCFDFVAPQNPDAMLTLKCCVAKRLHAECSKAFAGPWSDQQNVEIVQIGGGLSNYLFCASLKPEARQTLTNSMPHKVLIRIYGEVLRNNADWVILESIIFALLSEKKLGPVLHSLFPGGRIEQYIDSRPLRTQELAIPGVSTYLARKMGHFHQLTMPLVKRPVYILKTLKRFLGQLSDPDKFPRRPNSTCVLQGPSTGSDHGIPVRHDSRSQKPDPVDELTNGKSTSDDQRRRTVSQTVPNPLLKRCDKCSSSDVASDEVTCSSGSSEEDDLHVRVQRILEQYKVLEEYQWLYQQMTEKYSKQFPSVFCHNDYQENNILVVPVPDHQGRLKFLPIDFEYCSYNFRGFDLGNHFNEWLFEYSDEKLNGCGFTTKLANYPNREQQLHFICHYLNAYYCWKAGQGKAIDEYLQYEPTPEDELESKTLPVPTNLNKLRNVRFGGEEEAASVPDRLSLDQLKAKWPLTEWEQNEDNLLLEAYYGSITSHLFWGVWSLIQSFISSIDFNFLQYAEVRLRLYHRMKLDRENMEKHLPRD